MKLHIRPSRLTTLAAALLLLVFGLATAPGCDGCSDKGVAPTSASDDDDDDDDEAAENKSEKSSKAAAATATRKPIDMPDAVVGMAGIISLDKALEAAVTAGNKIAPGQVPPTLASMAVETFKTMLGVKDTDWLVKDAPIYYVLLDPKSHEGKGSVLVLPISDRAKLEAALPEGVVKDQGHDAVYEHQLQKVHLDFIDGHAIFSEHPDLYGKCKDFVASTVVKWTPSKLVSVRMDMNNVNRLYGADLDAAKRDLSGLYAAVANEPGMPDMSEIIALEVDMLFSIIESSDQADVDMWLAGDDLDLAIGVLPKKGSTMAKFTETTAGKSSSLVGATPASTWLGVATNMDTRKIVSFRDLQKASIKAYKGVLELSDEDVTQINGVLDRVADLATGESATALYQDGKFPMAIGGVMKLTDSDAAKKAYGELTDLLFAKLWALLVKEAGADMPPQAKTLKSMDELAAMVNGLVAPMGGKVQIINEDKGGVHVAGLIAEADWERAGLKEAEPEMYALLTEVVGTKFQAVFGFKDGLMTIGVGPNGMATAIDLANGKQPGGEKTLKAVNDGNTLAMAVRIDTALKAWMGASADGMAQIEAIPVGRSFTTTLTSAGGAATLTVGLPLDVVAKLSEMSF